MANAENDNKGPGLQARLESLRTWTSHEQINVPFWYEHVVFAVFSLIILLLIVFTT